MKNRTLLWAVIAACLGGFVGFSIRSQKPGAPSPKATAAPVGPVVHTFPDEASMREFLVLWKARQESMQRLGIVRSYWNAEQARLTHLADQLQTTYQLNPTKNYTLDDQAKAIRERVPAAADAAGKTEPAEGPIVFTFQDDAAMKAFRDVWQQLQAMRVRMTVLESYWAEEKQRLAKVLQELNSRYGLKADQDFTLDTARRVLLERPKTAQPDAQTSPPEEVGDPSVVSPDSALTPDQAPHATPQQPASPLVPGGAKGN